MPRITNINFRKGTSSEWTTANPVLDNGEPGYDTTNKILKIGDGVNLWSALPAINSSTTNSNTSVDNSICNGRLTLESNVAISTTNQTAKTILYFTPYGGNNIALYSGTAWSILAFNELSLSLSGYVANTNYDIFIYNNSGTPTLESTSWTNNTTRATALALQDGVYVRSGASTRRYLGTIRITNTTGQCEDSTSRRFVWNMYNAVSRHIYISLNTSHSYATTAWRAWNNNTVVGQGRCEFVLGLASSIDTAATGFGHTSAVFESKSTSTVGVAFDNTTTAYSINNISYSNSDSADHDPSYVSIDSSIGYHYLQAIQRGGTYVWTRNDAGMPSYANYSFWKFNCVFKLLQ